MTQDLPPTRLAVVTGGTRGIGAAISEALHRASRRVVANYRNRYAEAWQFHDRTGIETVGFDASDFAESERAMGAITSRQGTVSILVNNAGTVADASMSSMTRAPRETVLDNPGAAFNMSKLTFDGRRAQHSGRIVNISGSNAQAGQQRQINCAAAKANAVAPGYIDTEMLRGMSAAAMAKVIARLSVGRLGRTDEIARGIVSLSDDDAGFVTGSTISINGGQHMY